MYRVVRKFADLQDGNHIYNVGDKFPYIDKKVKAERLEELLSNKNKIGFPLIEEVKENVNDDGTVSGTEKLVRQESEKVSGQVRSKTRRTKKS